MIPEEQLSKLIFTPDCPICDWMKEWSTREIGEFSLLMQPYIPHRLQHSIDELTKKLSK